MSNLSPKNVVEPSQTQVSACPSLPSVDLGTTARF
jgi:hypothetical protein